MHGLGSYPFHQDELYTLIEASELFDTTLKPGIRARPLYYLLQHVVLDLLPQTELGLRLPAFAFGVFGIWLTGHVALRIFGSSGGLIAALVVTLSPWHVYVSGLARYWSLVYVLSLLAFWFVLRAYASDRVEHYWAALTTLVLGALTHPSFLFLVVGMAVGITLVTVEGPFGWRWPSRRAWRHLWVPFSLVLLAALAALLLTGSEGALRNFEGRGPAATLRLLPAVVQWLTPIYAVTATVGVVLLLGFRSHPEWRRWAAMTGGAAVSTLAFLVVASTRTDVYFTHAMAIVPLAFVSIGGLVEAGSQRLTLARVPFGVVAGAILAGSVVPDVLSQWSDGSRFDYRPAYRAISSTAPEVLVLTWPIEIQRRYAPELRSHHLPLEANALDSLFLGEPALWVVASVRRGRIPGDDSMSVARWLARNCRLHASFGRPRFDYRDYQVDLHYCEKSTFRGGDR